MVLMRSTRLRHGWSQRELSLKVDCSTHHVGQIERGTRVPSLWVLHRIGRAMGLSDQALLLDYIGPCVADRSQKILP